MADNSGSSTTLVVVGLVGFCCLVSVAVGAYLYFNKEAWAWVKSKLGFGDDSPTTTTPAPTPLDDTGDGVEDGTTESLTPTDSSPPQSPDTPPSAPGPDTPPSDGGGGGGDCEAKGSCSNKTGFKWFCPYPWDREYVNYSKDGKSAKCCKKSGSNYNDSDACQSQAMRMRKGASDDSVRKLHKFLKDNRGSLYSYSAENSYDKPCPCDTSKNTFNVRLKKDGRVDRLACIFLQSGSTKSCYPHCANNTKVGPNADACLRNGRNTVEKVTWKTSR